MAPIKTENKKFLKELKKKDKKRKISRDKEKEKEKKRAKYRSETSSESETDESDIDLDEDVFPISHYINDRTEMINQVFSTIAGKKLKSMLPPSLVDLHIDELKAICLDQLMGMSKKRLKHVLAGQEMLESSGTESDTEDDEKAKGSESEEDGFQNIFKKDGTKRSHKIAFGKKESQAPVKKKVILSTGKTVQHERSKKEDSEKKEGEDQGKTMMELLELEMRARAIKALLMKAGKEEGEAETLAIEEALDEAKKKEQDKEKDKVKEEQKTEDSSNKKRNIRKREDSGEVEKDNTEEKMETDDKKADVVEAKDDRVFNSENKAMSKARQMLLMSENKKMIQDEIKTRKEQEALFLYEEQIRKEKMEAERIERERLAEEAKEQKRLLIEKEQIERKKILEKERDKMIADHKRKEEMKKNKDKEKLLNRIKAMKESEQKEKEALEEHHKTKMKKKDLEEGERLDSGKVYRTKDDKIEIENDIHENISSSASPEERRPYDREEPQEKRRAVNRSQTEGKGKTRPKKKVEGGSDVEAGEVEDDVDSDAEDEVDREEDHAELLQKMRNLKKKLVIKAEAAAAEAVTGGSSNTEEAETAEAASSSGRGGRSGRGRIRRGRRGEEDSEWSLKKYDFDAPDIAESVKDHKPKFVKAPKRVFEKHDGYYSHSSSGSDQDDDSKKEEKIKVKKEEKKVKKKAEDSGFKKVTKDEWKKMSRDEKKKYLRDRKKWKEANTKYIKDDSDNEQLNSSDNDDEEDELELSASEDEKDKEERLAKKALKSYADSFAAQEAPPEDYKLVMRKDVWDKELDDDVAEPGFETLEDIEIRDKQEKMEQKTKTKQEKIRAERLRRMQAFQASSAVRVEEEAEEESEEENDEAVEETEEKDSFYSSYNEAMQGDGKDDIEDPLKEERLRRQKELAEDEAELAAMDTGAGGEDAGKRRKMAEFNLWKSQRRQSDPNKTSKDVVDAQQELDKAAGEERWKNDKKMKEVFTSSKLVSKAKMKMKLAAGAKEGNQEETKKEEEVAKSSMEEISKSTEGSAVVTEQPKDDTVTDLPGMIGSVNEYAKILGKSVTEMTEDKYQPPPAEASESEDEEGSDKEGDLWGAIMGAP